MYINTSSNYSNLIEFNDNYDTTPLTSDIYSRNNVLPVIHI
jgi:hypothetical protein